MKKLFASILAMVMALSISQSAFAASGVEVYYNGDMQNLQVRVEEIDGHVLVPMRAIMEQLGYTVQWDSWNKWIYCTSAQGKFLISLGLGTAMNNGYGTPYVMSTYPRLLDGTTMIPKDFAEYMTGTSMQYNADTNSLMILTNTGSGGALISGSGYINK